jgi:hypothetical protein
MTDCKITITFNRVDGSEMAKFDNIEDAQIFANAKYGTPKKEV